MEEKMTEVSRSDFQKIIDSFQKQNAQFDEHSNTAWRFVNSLKDITEPEKILEAKPEREPIGVVEMLNKEFDRMAKYNDVMRRVNDGLRKIIGS